MTPVRIAVGRRPFPHPPPAWGCPRDNLTAAAGGWRAAAHAGVSRADRARLQRLFRTPARLLPVVVVGVPGVAVVLGTDDLPHYLALGRPHPCEE